MLCPPLFLQQTLSFQHRSNNYVQTFIPPAFFTISTEFFTTEYLGFLIRDQPTLHNILQIFHISHEKLLFYFFILFFFTLVILDLFHHSHILFVFPLNRTEMVINLGVLSSFFSPFFI